MLVATVFEEARALVSEVPREVVVAAAHRAREVRWRRPRLCHGRWPCVGDGDSRWRKHSAEAREKMAISILERWQAERCSSHQNTAGHTARGRGNGGSGQESCRWRWESIEPHDKASRSSGGNRKAGEKGAVIVGKSQEMSKTQASLCSCVPVSVGVGD